MIGIYPGTFDPPTNGHFDIIQRGAHLFDKLYVGIAVHSFKQALFSEEERLQMIVEGLDDQSNIEVDIFSGLVADFAQEKKAGVILRGVRSVADYEYELQMAIANRHISDTELETILMLPSVQHSFISSRLVREAATLGGDVSRFVPPHVHQVLVAKLGNASK